MSAAQTLQAHAATERTGTLPDRIDTVIAHVLAALLMGAKMRSLDALGMASTVRLATAVHRLRKEYGWDIETREVTVSCADGRESVTVAEYAMPPGVIKAADARGYMEWAADVFEARQALRQKRGRA